MKTNARRDIESLADYQRGLADFALSSGQDSLEVHCRETSKWLEKLAANINEDGVVLSEFRKRTPEARKLLKAVERFKKANKIVAK